MDYHELRRRIEAELINDWRTPIPPKRTVKAESEAYIQAMLNDAKMIQQATRRAMLEYHREQAERLDY